MAANETYNWDGLALDIESAVAEACKQFRSLPEETIKARPNPGDWSVREIVGHLEAL